MKTLISAICTILFLSSFYSKNELLDCPTYIFKGVFLYEISEEARSLDDMIFRKRGIVFQYDNEPLYRQGLFLFEENKDSMIKEIYGDCKKLDYYSTFLSDSVHTFLDAIHGPIVEYNKILYKKLSLSIEAIPLGHQKVYFYQNSCIREELIPNFIVKKITVDWLYILSIKA